MSNVKIMNWAIIGFLQCRRHGREDKHYKTGILKIQVVT